MSEASRERGWSDFSVVEWQRLDNLSYHFDRELKTAFTRTVVQGNPQNDSIIKEIITDCVVEVGVTTANVYGILFNPESPRYRRLINELTDNYMKVVDNETAKQKVRAILPSGLSLSDRRARLNVLGLDARAAVRLERMRQRGTSKQDLEAARLDMSLQRGNLIALTEVNRIVNATLESLWLDNTSISKARKMRYEGEWFYETKDTARKITSLRGLPRAAVKKIVTRRDAKVCAYCAPLEEETAPIGAMFNTEYGLFKYPPFHPRCRCFMIVSV